MIARIKKGRSAVPVIMILIGRRAVFFSRRLIETARMDFQPRKLPRRFHSEHAAKNPQLQLTRGVFLEKSYRPVSRVRGWTVAALSNAFRSLVRNAATKMADLIKKRAEVQNPLVNQDTFDWTVGFLHAGPSEDNHYPSVFKGCKRVKTWVSYCPPGSFSLSLPPPPSTCLGWNQFIDALLLSPCLFNVMSHTCNHRTGHIWTAGQDTQFHANDTGWGLFTLLQSNRVTAKMVSASLYTWCAEDEQKHVHCWEYSDQAAWGPWPPAAEFKADPVEARSRWSNPGMDVHSSKNLLLVQLL